MRIPVLLLCCLLFAAVAPAGAQDISPAEELLAFEKLRDQVEKAFSFCTDPPEGLHNRESGCREASRLLLAIGPDVIPFLENELSQDTEYLDYLALRVLSSMPSEQTSRIIKESIQRYDRDPEDAKSRRHKLSALHALAVQGDPAVVDLANSGKILVGLDRHLYLKIPSLAVLSILTAPGSIPRLTKQIALYGEGDLYLDQLLAAAMALSQVAGPEQFDNLSGLLSHPEWPVRLAAVEGFRRLGDRRSVDRLIGILNDEPERRIRYKAAECLHRLKPAYAYERILAVLEKETVFSIRGLLYKTIAQIGRADAVPALLQHRGSPDPHDRRLLIAALGWTGSTQALPVIRRGLQDQETTVAIAAVYALDRIGSPGAVDSLLSGLSHPNNAVAISALNLLLTRDEHRAAPRAATLLLSEYLADDAPYQNRETIRSLVRALVDLRYFEVHREISAALKHQTDLTVRDTLAEAVTHLRLIETNGNDPDLWAGLLNNGNHATRSLAIANLGRIGTEKAVDCLLAGFGERDLEFQLDVVRHLDRARAGQIVGLLREIMLSPSFAPPRFDSLRATAAWTAGRIGGKPMTDVLVAASEQVQGTNMYYLLYLMKSMGQEAFPHLEATRIPRLRLRNSWRWQETDVLETVADDLRAGVRNPLLDTPPEKVEIQHY